MKRSQMYKKVNRKSGLFNHVNRNVVYPTIFFNPHLDDEENNKNGVEIFELHSDEDPYQNEQQNNHSWCNIRDRHQEYQDSYEVNKTISDKRREINENTVENRNGIKCSDEDALDQFVSDFYGLDCFDRGENISKLNPQSEFFTITNNHKTSDTSSNSNQYDDIEVIQYENTEEIDYLNCNNSYDDRTFTFDNDANAEKRTIWIYALKNKRYLSEHDFDLINIPSKDSNSTTDDEETSDDAPYVHRIATPIPTYIPKMNFSLSPTLPTVTEVSEPNKQASNNSDISAKKADADSPLRKALNGWCKNKSTETQTDSKQYAENKNYENNSQALSPREKRRLTQAKINDQNSKKEPEKQIYCEPTVIIRNKEVNPTSNVASYEREVDKIEINEDKIKTTNKELSSENKNDHSSDESLGNLQKLRIKLTPDKTPKKDISDPIEKLDGNWIGETLPKDDELLEVFDYYHNEKYNEVNDEYSMDDAQIASQKAGGAFEGCASDRLFIRNMSISKPAEWTQYLPFTDSVPSLHLSISVDTGCDHKRKSWFKRFLQFIHCCK